MKRQEQMIEIVVEGNETGRMIFINGAPDLAQVSQDVMDCFAEKLLEIIMESYDGENRPPSN